VIEYAICCEVGNQALISAPTSAGVFFATWLFITYKLCIKKIDIDFPLVF
jgi:hypothetical protein